MTSDQLVAAHHRDQERRGVLPSSVKRRDEAVRAFARYLEPRSLLDATRADVEDFLDRRHIGARTRYTWLSHLHSFYVWADREELSSLDPTARIVRPKLRRSLPRPAATGQLRQALDVADPQRRCWVLLAAYLGLRCQEIAGVRREDVLESEGLLRVVKGKGGKERLLPLHPDVLAALKALPMPRQGWVFIRPRGGPWSPCDLSNRFNRFLREAEVSATAHQLRHWFATSLYRETRDLRMTQEMMGHVDPSTTAIYTAFDLRDATEAVCALSFDDRDRSPGLRVVLGGLSA
jgi:integrase